MRPVRYHSVTGNDRAGELVSEPADAADVSDYSVVESGYPLIPLSEPLENYEKTLKDREELLSQSKKNILFYKSSQAFFDADIERTLGLINGDQLQKTWFWYQTIKDQVYAYIENEITMRLNEIQYFFDTFFVRENHKTTDFVAEKPDLDGNNCNESVVSSQCIDGSVLSGASFCSTTNSMETQKTNSDSDSFFGSRDVIISKSMTDSDNSSRVPNNDENNGNRVRKQRLKQIECSIPVAYSNNHNDNEVPSLGSESSLCSELSSKRYREEELVKQAPKKPRTFRSMSDLSPEQQAARRENNKGYSSKCLGKKNDELKVAVERKEQLEQDLEVMKGNNEAKIQSIINHPIASYTFRNELKRAQQEEHMQLEKRKRECEEYQKLKRNFKAAEEKYERHDTAYKAWTPKSIRNRATLGSRKCRSNKHRELCEAQFKSRELELMIATEKRITRMLDAEWADLVHMCQARVNGDPS